MPTVSVIIPTFNRAHYVVEAIESVLAQSYHDFELIIVDDGSTDETAQIIGEYQNRLQYFYQENQGPSAARNWGIHQATGTFIAFLDSDDLWHKDKLKTQMSLMNQQPEIKICYTNEIWIRNGVRVNQRKIHQKYSGWIFQRCLPLCIISPTSALIHREVFDKVGLFDENFIVCEDYDLWLRICSNYTVAFIDQPLITKRGGHSDQLSRKFWGMDRFRVMALEKILLQDHLNNEDRKAAIEMLTKKCHILATGFLKRGKIEEANKYQTISDIYKPKILK